MSKEKAPAFQFYPKDFVADGNVASMSLQERGAYVTLLCVCWLEQSLPDDVARLGRMVGATAPQMRRIWPAIRACFREHPDEQGRLIHPRLEQERKSQAEFRLKQAENGKKGGRPRKPKKTQRKPTANPNESQPQTQREARKSSPISVSDLLSPENPISDGDAAPSARTESEDSLLGTRAFIARFCELYAKYRNGAKYRIVASKHIPLLRGLLKTYGRQRLEKLTIVMLRASGDEWLNGTDRGVEILHAKVNWLEDRLAAYEAQHGEIKLAS
jgi:uncharacterized protein YdaU (DUF1376 family)